MEETWSMEDIELLIVEYEKRPVLYNNTLKYYKDNNRAWSKHLDYVFSFYVANEG